MTNGLRSRKTKVCRDCGDPKPINQFGRNAWCLTHGAKDGLNIYCKECVRTSVAAKRALLPKRLRDRRKPRGKRPQVKPVIVNRPIVLGAIRSGYNSREAIKEHTNLSMDEVVDVLADLAFETEELRIVRKGEVPTFYLADQRSDKRKRDQLAA